MASDKYKGMVENAVSEETATDDVWAQTNIIGGLNNLREAASLATQVKGEAFPSTTVPGAEVIVRRRPYGAM